jgi:farnesyl diphosphate synthase
MATTTDFSAWLAKFAVDFDKQLSVVLNDALSDDSGLHQSVKLLATVDVTAEQRIELVRILSQAAGHNGMVLGQHLDIAATSQSISFEALQNIHLLKTTALIASAIEMGAVLTGQNTDKWREFGEHIGMLFQVVDDILDATADSEQLGKTAGKDDAAQKPTAVSVLGRDEAREFAAQLCAAAENGLQQLDVESTNLLNQLPSFLLDRSF